MDKALLKAKILVILLYNGILYDPAFAGNRRDVGCIVALMHIHRMGQKQNGST